MSRVSVTEAVLFDWRGTLALGLTEERWVELALARLGRSHSSADVRTVLDELESAAAGAEFQAAVPRLDRSAEFHRDTYRRLFAAAGLDSALGDALYAVESDPSHNPLALDVPRAMRALSRQGVRIAVVSDIHFDIRPWFENVGLGGFVDAYALSYEVGAQKPEPGIFLHALELLHVEPRNALMVGDRLEYDGAAAGVGIPTLLLPPLHDITDQRLDLVVRAVGCGDEGRGSVATGDGPG